MMLKQRVGRVWRVFRNGLAATTLAVCGTNAWAVVQNVALVNPSGEPVANATVTIVFPDGARDTAETDDDGVLVFDFPDAGDYTIRFPGGEMTYSVDTAAVAAASRRGTGRWLGIGAGILAIGGLTAVLDNNGDGDDDIVAPAPVQDDGADPGNDPGDSGTNPAEGTYTCVHSVMSNEDGHPTTSLSGEYVVAAGGSPNLQHSAADTQFTITATLSGTDIAASGTGTFAGFSGASFNFDGTVPPLTGTLQVVCNACPDTDGDGTADPVQAALSCTGPA